MKKAIAIILLLSFSFPLYSQSLSDLILDLEEVSEIITDLESSNENRNEQLLNLQNKIEEMLSLSEMQEISFQELSEQLQEQAQVLQEQMKSYALLSRGFKILSYCTVGVTVLGLTGWILWATK